MVLTMSGDLHSHLISAQSRRQQQQTSVDHRERIKRGFHFLKLEYLLTVFLHMHANLCEIQLIVLLDMWCDVGIVFTTKRLVSTPTNTGRQQKRSLVFVVGFYFY